MAADPVTHVLAFWQEAKRRFRIRVSIDITLRRY
jgi:hypothetical protein